MPRDIEQIQKLFNRIAICFSSGVPIDTTAFRSTGVKYANEGDLLSGSGASYNGGRWNPRGIKAIYAALSPITAMKESCQDYLNYGFKPLNIRPRVFVGVRLKLNRLLNLTDHRVRRKLGFSLKDLIEEDWHSVQNSGDEAWTQAIGRGAFNAGFEGLLAPSARDRGGRNVVIFPENLTPDSAVSPISKEDLPPHPSDWPT